MTQQPPEVDDGFWNAIEWLPHISHPYLLEAYPEAGRNLDKARQAGEMFIRECEQVGRVGGPEANRMIDGRNWAEIKGLLRWGLVHGKKG